jgi:hypothetical protein
MVISASVSASAATRTVDRGSLPILSTRLYHQRHECLGDEDGTGSALSPVKTSDSATISVRPASSTRAWHARRSPAAVRSRLMLNPK